MTSPDVEWFLSAYLSPPGHDAFICMRHNHCIALWRRTPDSIELARYWEIERVSGLKHHAMPLFGEAGLRDFLGDLLAEEGLTLADVTTLWGTPGLKGFESIPAAVRPAGVSLHSLSHMWSSLLLDSELFKSSTILALALDAGPDFDLGVGSFDRFYAGAVFERGRLLTLEAVGSPAPLYKVACQTFQLEPGSLMALASASDAAAAIDVEPLVDVLDELVGPEQAPHASRVVGQIVDEVTRQLGDRADTADPRFSAKENIASAAGKVVQELSSRIAVRNAERLIAATGIDPAGAYLAMSGGFALNCPTNSRLMDHFGFRGLLAPPCANDSGQALGLGLMAFHERGDFDGRSFRFGSAFHGRDRLHLDEALRRWSAWVEEVTDFDIDTFVSDLATEPVAWVDGAAEVGPRALGHRSLLGDPRTTASKDRLNEVKLRQWWRPVAPIVLEESVGDWFVNARPSPYMLEVFEIRPERRAAVPAIAHLDHTARVQTITRATDSRLYDVVKGFGEVTGVPIICNTSLNDKGEPIVDDAVQALNFCIRRGLRVAYVAGRRVALRPAGSVPAPAPTGPEVRDSARFEQQVDEEKLAWQFWADHGVTPETLFAIGRLPELRELVRSEQGVRQGVLAARMAMSRHRLLGEGAEVKDPHRVRSYRFNGVEFAD
jgi:carbamoyltransferase